MPEKCLSCGESAVIEDDITGGGVQKICVECGTVATEVKVEITSSRLQVKEEPFPFFVVKREHLICQSCGDNLPFDLPADVNICPECQELESGDIDDIKQLVTEHSEVQCENENVSESLVSTQACTSCHGRSLCMESMGADERLVCRDCGTVAGSEALMNDDFEILSRSYRNRYLTLPVHARQPRKLRGKVAGHEKIAFLHNKFCFPEVIKEEAIEMFNQVFEKPPVLYMHVTTKEHVAAACLFIVCRQHDIPISLVHFQKYVDRLSVFLRGKKIVLKCLNTHLPHMTLSCQVEHQLAHCKFSSSIISKVKDILFLCRQAWLTQGRSREGLIIIAAYYAYNSSDMCPGFITMAKFRRLFKFPNISRHLQAECNSMLLKLASSIPWVLAKNVRSTTIFKYIDDILKYQNSLFQLAFRSPDNDCSRHDRHVSETDKGLSDIPKHKNAQQSENMPVHKRTLYDSSQKELLLPSVMKRPRKEVLEPDTSFLSGIDLDNPDVTELEFDEDEITSYLLSPEEEALVRTPKLKLMHN